MSKQEITKVYHNGNILTVNENDEVVEAVAIAGDKIAAVGSNEEIKAMADSSTEVIDLEKKTMIPGFLDPHSHFFQAGLRYNTEANLNSPNVGNVKSIEDIITILKDWGKDTPEGKLIKGYGYDDTSVVEKRRVNRDDLDRVSTKHPVIIRHMSGHLFAANTLGLELLGIDKDTPNPSDGIYVKDSETGEPTGVIEEALDKLNKVLANISPEDEKKSVAKANEIYSSVGVTTVSTGSTRELKEVDAIKTGQEEGIVKTRIVLNRTELVLDDLEGYDGYDDMLFEGVGKTFQDGSIQGYTGYLSEPYYVHDDPEYAGYPIRPVDELVKIVEKFHNRGDSIAIHCNGDQSIEDVIDAIEIVQEKYPREDPRHIAIHAQMAREDQLDRMKELGIVPSFFILHTYYWGDRHRDIFMGPERAARMSPLKSALDRDITFTTHCDTPVVPQDPLFAIWAAVNRLSASGEVIGEEQRIDIKNALRSYTINSAYQYKLEDKLGSIEPNKFADLVILSDNLYEVPDKEIKDVEVLETIVGGETIYTK